MFCVMTDADCFLLSVRRLSSLTILLHKRTPSGQDLGIEMGRERAGCEHLEKEEKGIDPAAAAPRRKSRWRGLSRERVPRE
jgi:hypothetical protein